MSNFLIYEQDGPLVTLTMNQPGRVVLFDHATLLNPNEKFCVYVCALMLTCAGAGNTDANSAQAPAIR